MYSTPLLFHLAKIIAAAGISLLALFITFNNIADYFSNCLFVEGIRNMDSIFPQRNLHQRNIDNPFLFQSFYINYYDGGLDCFLLPQRNRLMIKKPKNDSAIFSRLKKRVVAVKRN